MSVCVSAGAQELVSGKPEPPSADAIVDLIGGPMSKIFETIGPPPDMTVSDANSNAPLVCCDYTSFALLVRDKQCTGAFFWANYARPVQSVKFGATVDEVKEILGPPVTTQVQPGLIRLTWDVKGKNLKVRVDFDKDQKANRVYFGAK